MTESLGAASHQPAPSARPTTLAQPRWQPFAILWALALGVIGGLGCGWLIVQVGSLGAAALFGVGLLGGIVSRWITAAPCRLAASFLVATCMLAFVVAEVCWLHWDTVQGSESWAKAVTLLPQFVRDAPRSAFVGAVFAGLGAYSAFTQAMIPRSQINS